jgi:hypothetical protein
LISAGAGFASCGASALAGAPAGILTRILANAAIGGTASALSQALSGRKEPPDPRLGFVFGGAGALGDIIFPKSGWFGIIGASLAVVSGALISAAQNFLESGSNVRQQSSPVVGFPGVQSGPAVGRPSARSLDMRFLHRLALAALPIIATVYGIWLAQVLPPINVDGSDLQGRLIFAGVALLGLVVVTSELLSWYVGVTSLPARMQRLTSKSFARTDLDGSVGQLALTLGSVDRVRLAISVLVSGSALLLLLVTVAVAEILTLLAQANRGTIDPLLLASALFSIAWIAWIGYLCLIGAPRNREGRRRAYR